MNLTSRLARNTAANYIGTIVGFVVSLFLVPYTINMLGTTQYGVWALILSTFGFLALIDFGLANALAKYTAEYSTRNDRESVDRMTSTLFVLFSAIGLLVFIGIVAFSFVFNQFFAVPPEYATEAQWAIIIFGLRIGISLPLSVYNAIAVGNQRYVLINVGAAANYLLSFVLTVIVLQIGWGLIGLALVQVVTALTQPIWLRWSLRHRAGVMVRLSTSNASRALLAMMIGYSASMFVMMLSAQLEASVGPMIVGRMVSIDAVTDYSVGAKVGGMVRQFTFPMAQALFPAFATLYALRDSRRLGLLLTQSLRASALVTFPAVAITIVLARPLIELWIGPDFASSTLVAVPMVLEALVLQLMLTASSLLMGTGSLKLYTILHVFALVASITLGILAAPRWGAAGVAVASLLSWSMVLAVTLPYTARHANVRGSEVAVIALARPLVAALIAAFVLVGLRLWHYPDTIWALAFEAGSGGLIYLLMAAGICLSRNERSRLIGFARNFVLKLAPSAHRV